MIGRRIDRACTYRFQDRIGLAKPVSQHPHDMQRKFGFLLNEKIEPLAPDGQKPAIAFGHDRC